MSDSSIRASGRRGKSEFRLNQSGASGRAVQTDEGFVVLKGAELRPTLTSSAPGSARRNRERFAERISAHNILLEDTLFDSPSAASDFLTGSSTNGRAMWRTPNGVSLGDAEKQEAGIAAVSALKPARRSRRPKQQIREEERAAEPNEETEAGKSLLYLRSSTAEGIGYRVTDGFVVMAGSRLRQGVTSSGVGALKRRQLESRHISSDGYLARDLTFRTPSAAAKFLTGRSSDGNTLWKSEAGVPLKKLEPKEVTRMAEPSEADMGSVELEASRSGPDLQPGSTKRQQDSEVPIEDIPLFLDATGAKGVGFKTKLGFVVKAGSMHRSAVFNSGSGVRERRNAEAANISPENVLLSDISFSSPSAAARFLVGTSADGRTLWKTEQGVTLKELEEREQ